MKNTSTPFHAALVTAALSLPFATFAGEGKNQSAAPATEAPKAESPFSGSLTNIVFNKYIVRGIVFEDKGPAIWTIGNLNLNVYKDASNEVFQSVSLFGGIFTDVNTSAPLTANKTPTSARNFTEIDYFLGVSALLGKRLTVSSAFWEWASPSNVYKGGRFWRNDLSFSDAGWLGDNFAINPHLSIQYEIEGILGNRPHQWYFEPGISPSYTFFKGSDLPVTVALNVTAGLGGAFYGQKDELGFYSFGPQVSAPLNFIPKGYGSWSTSVGYSHVHSAKALHAADKSANNDIFSASLSVSF